jgi:DNA-binding SARP family transcriptional activator
LRSALATWRGRAYEDFAYESWAQGEISRLEELRLEAIENRIDVDLRLGRAREIVAELQSLIREQPLREHIVISLMLALYRSGRATEALRACSAYCRHLIGEFGVEPSRAMRDIEHRILTNDLDLLIGEVVEAASKERLVGSFLSRS